MNPNIFFPVQSFPRIRRSWFEATRNILMWMYLVWANDMSGKSENCLQLAKTSAHLFTQNISYHRIFCCCRHTVHADTERTFINVIVHSALARHSTRACIIMVWRPISTSHFRKEIRICDLISYNNNNQMCRRSVNLTSFPHAHFLFVLFSRQFFFRFGQIELRKMVEKIRKIIISRKWLCIHTNAIRLSQNLSTRFWRKEREKRKKKTKVIFFSYASLPCRECLQFNWLWLLIPN